MRKLSNTEAELKKSVAYKKSVYHIDKESYIFQKYYLFSLFLCLHICFICILSYLRLNYGQVSNKRLILKCGIN